MASRTESLVSTYRKETLSVDILLKLDWHFVNPFIRVSVDPSPCVYQSLSFCKKKVWTKCLVKTLARCESL
jgi:hypothetical protein